ncbi:hypothetical protein FVEG_15310 [Fusarium verticillioides 7600]|uniref:Uncharacterized protein n=1 Tax=Gibberella moniliformis (strain M3125 / FGSC 7600) TaxID=334819 RepID=W7LSN1_GIBM7|nr:hypothetical protein FVEG_15310 [Fusarium verticillioides 7600]EWG41566.1 hypothetical protein FVEG_15310 [Fusarium verticillioides 7600]
MSRWLADAVLVSTIVKEKIFWLLKESREDNVSTDLFIGKIARAVYLRQGIVCLLVHKDQRMGTVGQNCF